MNLILQNFFSLQVSILDIISKIFSRPIQIDSMKKTVFKWLQVRNWSDCCKKSNISHFLIKIANLTFSSPEKKDFQPRNGKLQDRWPKSFKKDFSKVALYLLNLETLITRCDVHLIAFGAKKYRSSLLSKVPQITFSCSCSKRESQTKESQGAFFSANSHLATKMH